MFKSKKKIFLYILLIIKNRCNQNKKLRTKMSFGDKNPFKDEEIGNKKFRE